MSFHDITVPPAKQWCDLYVNTVNFPSGYSLGIYVKAHYDFTTSGALTGASGTINVTKIGNQVTIGFPNVAGTGGTGSFIEYLPVLGAEYYPPITIAIPYCILIGTTQEIGVCNIQNNGQMAFTRTNQQAFPPGFMGVGGGSVTYLTTE